MLVGKDCIIFVITHIGLVHYENEEYVRIFVATSHSTVYSWVNFVTDDTFVLYPDLHVAFIQHVNFWPVASIQYLQF